MTPPPARPSLRIVALLSLLLAVGLQQVAVAAPTTHGPRDLRQPQLIQDSAAFPGAHPKAVRSQAAQCVVPQKLGVVFLLDDSGSMESNDRLKLRANAVELGLQELGASAYASAIRFSSTTSTIFGPTDLAAGAAPSAPAIAASLTNLGGTDYIDAFAAAKVQLDAFPSSVDQKIVVLLSDGEPTDSFTVATDVPALGARVFPIGFGSADNELLGQIAAASGGVNQAVSGGDTTQGAIARAIGASRCQAVDLPETFDLAPGQERIVPFNVPPGTPSFSVLATWSEGSIDMVLRRPDGSLLAPTTLRAGEALQPGATSARASVTGPAPGLWNAILVARLENVEAVSMAIDILGGPTQQHVLSHEPAPLRPGCTTSAVIGGRTAWGQCFEPTPGGVRSTLPIRIAGIDVTPRNGADIKLLFDGTLASDDAELSVYAKTSVVSGSVPIWTGKVRLPLSQGFHFEGTDRKVTKTQAASPKIAGLPIEQRAGFKLDWTVSGAKLTLILGTGELLDPITPPKDVDGKDPITGLKRGWGLEAVITTSNERGVAIDRIEGRLDEAKVYNKLVLKNVFLGYDSKDRIISGGGEVQLFDGPLAKHGLPTIKAELGVTINPIGFGRIELEVSDINKPIGPFVYLQKIGGKIQRIPAPWTVEASTGFSIGPQVTLPIFGKQTAVALDGTVKWQYPAVISGETSVKVFGQSAARSKITANLQEPEASLNTLVTLSFAGTGLTGVLDGWVKRGSMQLAGNASMQLFGKPVNGAEAFVSNLGAGACRRGWGPDYGWRADFRRKSVKAMLSACDFGGLMLLAKPAQIGGGASVQIGKSSRGELLQVIGVGGQPLGTLRGPDGTVVEIGADRGAIETPKVAAIPDEASNSVWVVLNQPARGAWTIEPRAGSAPLAIKGRAKAKAKARVRATLRRSKGKYRLTYSVRRAKGERLVLVERGPGGRSRKLTSTKRTQGSVSFSRFEGLAGQRTIEATVRGPGGVRLRTIVGKYTAKSAVRPGRPRALKVSRRGRTATITWKRPRSSTADRYVVVVRLKDGRRIETTVKRTRLRLNQVAKQTVGKVSVVTIGRSGLESRAARTNLRRRK